MQQRLPGAGGDGGTGRQALEAAHVTAGAGRAAGVERHVAHFARAAMRAAIDATVEDDASTNPGRDGDVHRVLSAARPSPARLAQRRAAGVILNPDSYTQHL